ncbi:DnaJ domain-containing protein [Arthrobacter sp. PM3]|uniref:DnaJ domain-containing protein n=1 Tax=Arthrobacter sp. PM3 TaxID=2017685 RepID=UPI000E10E012|nr:DnaJ domain-containing protein [Arthrobacter sp. PM3]AXJ08554.1 molecular chaperone DnaJ [Arthrobacter sp. PM3]
MSERNPDSRGYYALLRVSPDASRQEISRAFRALMRRRHPDVGHPDAGAGGPDSDVRAILDAFAVLRDPVARAAYDAGMGPAAGESGAESGEHKAGGATAETAGAGGRDIPVHIIRRRDPLVRVFPVRWEP